MSKKNIDLKFNKMLTTAGERLPEIPWNIYPRPQLKRDSFLCLNGEWAFGVKGEDGTLALDKKIIVPFAPESVLSKIDTVYPDGATLVYSKKFTLPKGFNKGRVILNFGAVSQIARVYFNGNFIIEHKNGYTPFSAEVTPYLKDENIVTVECKRTLCDLVHPYGKQSLNRGGMWYTPTSGIWQTVWLESVANEYIKDLTVKTDENRVTITLEGVKKATLIVTTNTGEIKVKTEDGTFKFTVDSPEFWSPENPYLYNFIVTAGKDSVQSYFALRTLSIKEVNGVKRLLLNGKPYFFHGLLDQGYFSDGIFTPASPEVYTEEIKKVKALGFNTLRKHVKIEPQVYYYDCDRLGVIVWQDMINNGDYKFMRDTVLPTIGLIRKKDKNIHKSQVHRQAFLSNMEETVKVVKNHPSVCYYTIFNEGWGQFDSQTVYEKLKSLDDTRFIDTTSGWFFAGETDVDSRHIYFRKPKVKRSDKPIVISEFGGYVYSVKGHTFNTLKTYGYGKCDTRNQFVERLRDLYLTAVIPAIKTGLCGTIYTQVSDVEDETNGLFTYDRKVDKITPEEFSDIATAIYEEIEK